MNPIPATFTIAAIVALARWRKGEMISIDNVVGVAGMAVVLAVLNHMSTDLARSFGLLAVVGTALYQVPAIIESAELDRGNG